MNRLKRKKSQKLMMVSSQFFFVTKLHSFTGDKNRLQILIDNTHVWYTVDGIE